MIIGRLSVRSEERRGLRKKIGKRRQIESGGHPGNTMICLKLIIQSFYILKSKRGGKRLLYHDRKNKVISSNISKHPITTGKHNSHHSSEKLPFTEDGDNYEDPQLVKL